MCSNRYRRFSFSLRTLLLIVAIGGLSCWLAGQANWVRQRRQVIDGRSGYSTDSNTVLPGPDAPGMLWLFAEHGYASITIKFDDGDCGGPLSSEQQNELDRVRQLFPECRAIRGIVW